MAGATHMYAQAFFRWRVVAIALWVLGVLFGLFAALNVWLAAQASAGRIPDLTHGDSNTLARSLFRGAAENVTIAVFCITGWFFMRRRTPPALLIGGSAVMLDLFITFKRWMSWQIAGNNPFPWSEPLLVWPFLLYAIVYAYRESRVSSALITATIKVRP